MSQNARVTVAVLVATGATLLAGASVALAFGELPEQIDPDCEPEKALVADPALVKPADAVCPPDYTPVELPAGPVEPPAATPPPEEPPVEPPVVPLVAPPPAPQLLPPERTQEPVVQRRKPRLKAERESRPTKNQPSPRLKRARKPSEGGGTPATPTTPVLPAVPETGIPAFLLPIYRAAGERYGIPWEVLAAINAIETDYGRNLGVSSAGAEGWMQFMPGTWSAYGVDANGDGLRNPYDPVDAIHSAAHYLSASGYAADPRAALFAYNHADWYVDWVLVRAAAIASGVVVLPDPLKKARRLAPRFAAELARVAEHAGLRWQLMLAVLRARGHSGRVPASGVELERLSRRLVSLGVRRDTRLAIRRIAGKRPLRARRIVALAHYHRAIGLRGLVRGLERVKPRLARQVLRSPRLEIYEAGRLDIERGVTDVRVLVLLRYLGSRYREVTVTSLTAGHSYLTASGNVSAHSHGRAVDIAALNGTPILGHQDPGGLTERALWNILLLPRELQPEELISLYALGGPSFALADHADHIHVGY